MYLLKKEIWFYKLEKLNYLISSYWNYCFFSLTHFFLILFRRKKTSILIILTEHLGDIIAAEPLIQQIKAKYPSSKIHWLIRKPFQDLIIHHPQIDQVILEKSFLFTKLIAWCNPFHLTYHLHLSKTRKDPYFDEYLINAKADKKNITCENYLNKGNLLKNFSTIADFEYRSESPKIYLPPKNPWREKEAYIVVHRKSNNSLKDWKDEYWEVLIEDLISEFGLIVYDIGLDTPLNVKNPKFNSLIGKTSLTETMQIIQNASYFLGVDSGPAHIANAFKIKSILLFGEFYNFKNYQVYAGNFEKPEIANFIRNENGPTCELTFENVKKEISSFISKNG